MDYIETDKITPDAPVGLEVAYRNSRGILIEWSNTNVCTVDHYEVHWELNKHTVNTEVTKNCYAAGKFLHSNESYLIKVRAVNRSSQKSEFAKIKAKTKSDFISTLVVLVSAMFIGIVTHVYMSVHLFFALLVAMIATFLCISTKHARLMSYLLALVVTGNIIIAVILDLWFPVKIFKLTFMHVLAVLVSNIVFFHLYREDIQLVNYMLEKHNVSLQVKERLKKQAMQINMPAVFLLLGATLISFAFLQCFNYFIPTVNIITYY